MPPVLIIIVFLAFVALVVTLGVYAARKARERREAFERLADSLGLRFFPDHVPAGDQNPGGGFFERLFTGRDIPGPYAAFDRFKHGDNRKAYNTLVGQLATGVGPCETWAGDFSYDTTSGSGKDRKTHDHAPLQLYARQRPRFTPAASRSGRENFLDRFGAMIGLDDIDFESARVQRRVPRRRRRQAVRLRPDSPADDAVPA